MVTSNNKFLMPSYGWNFMGGLLCGTAFCAALYIGKMYYPELPSERLLGPSIIKEISLEISLYFAMYVLFFWGILAIIQKGNMVNHEAMALVKLEQSWQSHTIISNRTELDNVRAMMTQGHEMAIIRNTALVKTLLFLIEHCLVTQSSSRVLEIFSRRMTTLQNHAESSYNLLRYIAWGIPAIGFVGTVMGIGQALGFAENALENLKLVTDPLGLAFDTTFIALVESLILMFFIHYMQNREEALLNDIDLFCQEKLIINLRIEEEKTPSHPTMPSNP